MKKTRLFALLCVLALLAGMAGTASAGKRQNIQTATRSDAVSWKEYRYLKNGENASLVVFSEAYGLYEKKGSNYKSYEDIVFACKGKVKAESNVSWISIMDGVRGPTIGIEWNTGLKKRTGKITVTGKGYKASIKIIQYGNDSFESITRKKNKITVKLRYGDAPGHGLSIYAYKGNQNETIFNGTFKKTSYTFKIKKGWTYSISFGPQLKTKLPNGKTGTLSFYNNWYGFTVVKTTGQEILMSTD